jgi:RecJ-like exonuclease
MVKCFKCAGNGKAETEEWERQWDRYDQNSPSHYDTNLWMGNSGITQYETCPVCSGKGELEKLEELRIHNQLNDKKVTIEKFYDSGFQDYVLLHFEDGLFAKVPLKDIEYFKKN